MFPVPYRALEAVTLGVGPFHSQWSEVFEAALKTN